MREWNPFNIKVCLKFIDRVTTTVSQKTLPDSVYKLGIKLGDKFNTTLLGGLNIVGTANMLDGSYTKQCYVSVLDQTQPWFSDTDYTVTIRTSDDSSFNSFSELHLLFFYFPKLITVTNDNSSLP